jgi:hypothetical protein
VTCVIHKTHVSSWQLNFIPDSANDVVMANGLWFENWELLLACYFDVVDYLLVFSLVKSFAVFCSTRSNGLQ